jgi:hypothetical protein
MTNSKILSAKQLLLICLIRKEVVRAKNLQAFGGYLPFVRNFFARSGDFLSLADHDECLSWYWDFSTNSPKYSGKFELEEEIFFRESEAIRVFCPLFKIHIREIQVGDIYKHLPFGEEKVLESEEEIVWEFINPDDYIAWTDNLDGRRQ